jgi:hypothetical protein
MWYMILPFLGFFFVIPFGYEKPPCRLTMEEIEEVYRKRRAEWRTLRNLILVILVAFGPLLAFVYSMATLSCWMGHTADCIHWTG